VIVVPNLSLTKQSSRSLRIYMRT